MNIEFGKAVDNKTWRFLIPSIKGHGETFINKFNTEVTKLAYGIHDTLLDGAGILTDKRPIFMLCDRGVLPTKFNNFLSWIKYQPYYITDYQSDTNMQNPRMHMIVFEVPEKYYRAYDKFCVGLYSEMYTKEQLDSLIRDRDSERYKILSKDPKYAKVFLEKITDRFGVSISGSDKTTFLQDAEYEFPYSLDCGDEIFNY